MFFTNPKEIVINIAIISHITKELSFFINEKNINNIVNKKNVIEIFTVLIYFLIIYI